MTARKRVTRTCNANGCTVEVRRGILMCREHWFALPRPLQQAIRETWAARRMHDWSANCLAARAFLAGRDANAVFQAVSPQASYALQQRMLGEREEA